MSVDLHNKTTRLAYRYLYKNRKISKDNMVYIMDIKYEYNRDEPRNVFGNVIIIFECYTNFLESSLQYIALFSYKNPNDFVIATMCDDYA